MLFTRRIYRKPLHGLAKCPVRNRPLNPHDFGVPSLPDLRRRKSEWEREPGSGSGPERRRERSGCRGSGGPLADACGGPVFRRGGDDPELFGGGRGVDDFLQLDREQGLRPLGSVRSVLRAMLAPCSLSEPPPRLAGTDAPSKYFHLFYARQSESGHPWVTLGSV